MSIFGSIFGTDDNNENQNKNTNRTNNTSDNQTQEGTLQLKKEELDINKNKVETGEVILSKEVVEEQQSVNVPVTHEEVIIERKQLNNQPTDSQITSSSNSDSSSGCGCDNTDSQTIRIPVTEERVEVGKHTVVTEEVSAHKCNVEQTQKVEETLRREEAKIDKNGTAVINNKDATSGNNTSSNNDASGNNSSSDDSKSNSWF
jgi:uncharacterized protein (TIGR02271 family)